MNKQNSDGFTLIELLVSLTILAIVAAIAVPLYTQFSQRTYRTELQADLMGCAQALERFNAINFTYIGAAVGGAQNGVVSPDVCPALSVAEQRYRIDIVADVETYTLTGVPLAGPMNGDGDITIDDTGARTWDENDNNVIDANENDWTED